MLVLAVVETQEVEVLAIGVVVWVVCVCGGVGGWRCMRVGCRWGLVARALTTYRIQKSTGKGD